MIVSPYWFINEHVWNGNKEGTVIVFLGKTRKLERSVCYTRCGKSEYAQLHTVRDITDFTIPIPIKKLISNFQENFQ